MYKICKTEHSAARQREMELGLMKLMTLQRYEDITVSDLCEHLQIPRKSFYRYFCSKDGALNALLDHTMLEYESFNVVYKEGEHRTPAKDFAQFFKFWLQHTELLEVLEKNRMSAYLVERTLNHIASHKLIPARFLWHKTEYEKKQITLFCISGLMSIMLSWHKEGFPRSAEEMGTIAAELISQPLFPNLDLLL